MLQVKYDPITVPANTSKLPVDISAQQTKAAILGLLNQSLQATVALSADVNGALLKLLQSSTVSASDSALLAAVVTSPAGQCLTGHIAGIATLAVHGAQCCLTLADAVACISVEALQGSPSCFEGEVNEGVRAHGGQTASASTCRLLLENSAEAGKAAAAAAKAGKDSAEAASLLSIESSCAHISSLHGSASAAILSAMRVVGTELNAQAAGAAQAGAGGKGKKDGDAGSGSTRLPSPLHAAPLLTSLQSASAAVDVLLAACHARAQALGLAAAALPRPAQPAATSAHVPVSDAQSAALCSAVDLQLRVDSLLSCLALEVHAASEGVLRPREQAQAEALAVKEKAKAAAAAKKEAEDAAKLAAMPEGSAERLKFEAELAKRKEKARLRAEEEAAGASAGAANPLGLAAGTFEFLAHLRSTASSLGGSSPSSYLRALSPYFPYAALAGTGASMLGGPVLAAGDNGPLPPSAYTTADGAALLRADAFLRRLMERLSSGGSKRKPKVAKGARDYGPEQMEVREACFNTIRSVFKRHGAVEIDTPVFELKETLLGKYGEEGGKLIYDLADQGGELLSLRYDLTVPFARYLALHGVEAMKRYHIAKVYRRDNPQISKGRYREFYQCDYDVAGVYAPMMPDAEVLKVAVDILSSLPIGEFAIKLNHRKLLDAMLDIAGVPSRQFRPICSAIDKLDKEPWEAVKAEMVLEKGLPEAVADKIGAMVQLRGEPKALLAKLTAPGSFFEGHPAAQSALADLAILFKYLASMGNALARITFDLSLARGLDYYTGVIYEAVLLDPTAGVGSIAAGGRYDNLVGMFANPGTVVPCVGVSIGVERVFAIMEAKQAKEGGLKRTAVQVLVASIPSTRYDMTVERMATLAALWDAGLSAEMLYSESPKLAKQMTGALETGIPYIVILAEDELDQGQVTVKDLAGHSQVTVPRPQVVPTLLGMGARVTASGVALAAAASAQASGAAAAPPAAANSSGSTFGTAAAQSNLVIEGGPVGRFARPTVPIQL